jgi:hypothetical protein
MTFSGRFLRGADGDSEHRTVHQIEKLIALLTSDLEAEDHALVAGLLRAGVGRRSAMRLVVLVPSAFGRDLVTGLGAVVDPNVEILSEDGSSRTIRRLDSFPEFKAAMSLIPKLRDHPRISL